MVSTVTVREVCGYLDRIYVYMISIDYVYKSCTFKCRIVTKHCEIYFSQAKDVRDPIEMDEEIYHQILLDQLTVSHARGSVAVRADHIAHVCITLKGFCLLLKIGMLSNVCLRYHLINIVTGSEKTHKIYIASLILLYIKDHLATEICKFLGS